jgi:drug/metabolite transporter, DME family
VMLAIAVLSVGAGQANAVVSQQTEAPTGPLWVALAVGALLAAGTIFAVLAITIRKSVTSAVSPAAVVLMIPGMALVIWGPVSLARFGLAGLAHTPPGQIGVMLLAGLLNVVAFASVSKGLQTATVVYANVVSASQTALAALCGLVLFAEPASPSLMWGVGLTIAGLVVNDPSRQGELP